MGYTKSPQAHCHFIYALFYGKHYNNGSLTLDMLESLCFGIIRPWRLFLRRRWMIHIYILHRKKFKVVGTLLHT